MRGWAFAAAGVVAGLGLGVTGCRHVDDLDAPSLRWELEPGLCGWKRAVDAEGVLWEEHGCENGAPPMRRVRRLKDHEFRRITDSRSSLPDGGGTITEAQHAAVLEAFELVIDMPPYRCEAPPMVTFVDAEGTSQTWEVERCAAEPGDAAPVAAAPLEPSCDAERPCAQGLACIAGECAACRDDADCTDGAKCDHSSQRCGPPESPIAPPDPGGLPITWLDRDAPVPAGLTPPPTVRLVSALPRDAREAGLTGDQHEGWVPLDDRGRFWLTQLRWGAVESSLLVVNQEGRVRGTVNFDLRVSRVGVVDAVDDETKEIVVEGIEGTSLSYYPRAWWVYRVTRAGVLVRLADLPQSFSWGAKCFAFIYRNQVSIPRKGAFRVANVFVSADDHDASGPKVVNHAGETYEMVWDRATRKLERRDLPDSPTNPRYGGCSNPTGKRPGASLADPFG